MKLLAEDVFGIKTKLQFNFSTTLLSITIKTVETISEIRFSWTKRKNRRGKIKKHVKNKNI